ncbi:MAG: FAD-binding oxidoreductase [Alteromonadaceae bacterium]|nr:FAD-binding oxidoreductase [Alteromonadaceae bacterium]
MNTNRKDNITNFRVERSTDKATGHAADKKSIAVIGAGIIGVNCAVELQTLGFNVTLLDKDNVGEGCSKGNAGHFATEQVFPLAQISLLWQLPKLLLDPLGPMAISPSYFPKAIPWFLKFIGNMTNKNRTKNSAAIKSLNKNAIAYYKTVLEAANAKHLLTTKGSLLVFEDTPLASVTKQYRQYHHAGVPVKLLNREQVLALEPNLNEKIQHALYFTDVGHTSNPHEICMALAEYAKKLGSVFKQFSVTEIKYGDLNVTISDGQTDLVFDQVVIATGAWSKKLLKQLDYKLPIEAERGYSLNLPNTKVNAELTRPVASAERRFIMTPMAHGLRLAGTVEFAGLEKKANMKRADMLYTHAKNMLINIPDFDESNSENKNDNKSDKTEQKWLGFRPSLPDSLPVIGQAPNHKNVYFALGHQHLGLTQGAITGKLIGQIITGQQTDIDISPFCISRFN